jgi:hypothetical protein
LVGEEGLVFFLFRFVRVDHSGKPLEVVEALMGSGGGKSEGDEVEVLFEPDETGGDPVLSSVQCSDPLGRAPVSGDVSCESPVPQLFASFEDGAEVGDGGMQEVPEPLGEGTGVSVLRRSFGFVGEGEQVKGVNVVSGPPHRPLSGGGVPGGESDESSTGSMALVGDEEGGKPPFISDKTRGTRLSAGVDWDAVESDLEGVLLVFQLGDPLAGGGDFLISLFGASKERPCGCLSHSAKVLG